MALPRITSPHTTGSNRTQRVMLQVLLATLPGVLTLTWLYGCGPLLNLLWASIVALGCEAAVLAARKRPLRFCISALCLGLCGLPLRISRRIHHRLNHTSRGHRHHHLA